MKPKWVRLLLRLGPRLFEAKRRFTQLHLTHAFSLCALRSRIPTFSIESKKDICIYIYMCVCMCALYGPDCAALCHCVASYLSLYAAAVAAVGWAYL